MAKKPDMTKVKEFFFHHGERVALGACLTIAVLLIVLGLWGAAGAGGENGVAWTEQFKSKTSNVNMKLASGIGDVKVEPLKVPEPWNPFASNFQQGPMLNFADQPDFKRHNPIVLPIMKDPARDDELFQLDVIHRGHLGHVVNYQKEQVLGLVGAGGPRPGGMLGGGVLGGPGMPAQPGGAGVGQGGGSRLAEDLKPKRLIVVSAIFPMKKQLDEFRKALRLKDVEELFARGELPRMAGLDIYRVEHVPGGKPVGTPLAYSDPKKAEKLVIHRNLDYTIREALYDEKNPTELAVLIHDGLVTPLPLLPEGKSYPRLKIKSEDWLELPEEPKAAEEAAPMGLGPVMPGGAPAMPKGPAAAGGAGPRPGGAEGGGMLGGGAPATAAEKEKWIPFTQLVKEQRKDLVDKYKGKYNLFHPFGQFSNQAAPRPGAEGGIPMAPMAPMAGGMLGAGAGQGGQAVFGFGAWEGGVGGGMPGGVVGPMAGGSLGPAPGGGAAAPRPGLPAPMGQEGVGAQPGENPAAPVAKGRKMYDALVRFVDPDVEPGKTYSYFVRVRMFNPNHGKPGEVAAIAWADAKELDPSPWVETPRVTTPTEYHLYAVDQRQLDLSAEKRDKEWDKSTPMPKADQTILQVHRWVPKAADPQGSLVSDWAIAERLIVRKGEQIGSSDLLVEMPIWNRGLGSFELVNAAPQGREKFNKQPGVPIDLIPEVVTAGGGKTPAPPYLVDFDGGKKTHTKLGITEEVAVDVLILGPDGKLVARNSRLDADVFNNDEELKAQAEERQKRVSDWRERLKLYRDGGAGGGANMPGVPGGLGPAPGN